MINHKARLTTLTPEMVNNQYWKYRKWLGSHADTTRPGWSRVLQGTYLPAKIGLDLEEMQRHTILQDLGKQVKNLYEKLHLQHDLLRGAHSELSSQQPVQTSSLVGKISGRLESISSWKYAPRPLRSMRSSLTGELPNLCIQILVYAVSGSRAMATTAWPMNQQEGHAFMTFKYPCVPE